MSWIFQRIHTTCFLLNEILSEHNIFYLQGKGSMGYINLSYLI